MPKLKPIKPEKLIKILQKMGFEEKRQKGSHKSFYNPDGRVLTVPFHKGKEISIDLLNKIIKHELKITREEFEKYL
ncbi:MAG: type II toxin-antitoxin system HicA family toxin [Candidatus Diapherotrites archaeon]|nr:type II toxin-antitoxin system HicA family toxin [Candidatus Diapherotrites archaeon]